MAQAREKPDIEAIVKDPVKHFATPREVVMDVRTVRRPQIDVADAAGAIAVEEHPMAVARKTWNVVDYRRVHRRSQVSWHAPRRVYRRALGNV